MPHFHWEEIGSFFMGGMGFSLLSYAAQTIPQPKNVWALWFVGIIQFGLANKNLGKQNFQAAKEDPKEDK